MFSMKKLAAGLAISALALPLAACGSSNSSSGGDGDSNVEISYFSWINEKQMAPIIKEFESENPGIKVDLSTAQGAANDYVQTLTTRIAGGQTPDVFHISTATRADIINNGHALDLSNEPFMKGLDPTGVEMYSKDGKKYGLPTSAWMGVLIYNKDILKEAGYDAPPTKLSEFIEMGKKITANGKKAYMEDPTVVSGSFLPMLGGYYAKTGQSDEEIFSGKTTFEKQWTEPITEWSQLVKEGVIPPEVISLSEDLIQQSFLNGEVAMYRSGIWAAEDLHNAGINFGVAPFPALSNGEPFVGGGPDSPFAINSKLKGPKLEAAKKFLAFMNSEKGLSLLAEHAGWISTSQNYKAEVPDEFQDVYENYLMTGKYYWINLPEGGSNIEQDMPKQFQLLMQGNATPQDVAKKLDSAWSGR